MIQTLNDRIALLYGDILPKVSSIAKMKTIKDVKAKVAFSEAEAAELNLVVQQNGAIAYRSTKPLSDYSLDVEFTEEELSLLKAGAQLLDANEQVTEDTLPTIIKFIECS